MEHEDGHIQRVSFYVVEPGGTVGPREKSAEEALKAWKEANPGKSVEGCQIQQMTLDMRIVITNVRPF